MSFLNKLFGLDRVTSHDASITAHLTTVYGNEQLVAVEALLRSADIAYRCCDRGAGGVVRVVLGNTMYGTDIFVRPDDLETAQALLLPATDENEQSVQDADAMEQSEETDEQ